MDIAQVRQTLQKLLERYNKFKDDKNFLSNEKQICESLILPLVRNVLHWDTEDPAEFRLEEQRAGKRPDYLVYYQGMTQFIVEAKAATKNIFEDEVALKQALEYGYNADKYFVILTNFIQIVILAPKIQYRNVLEAIIARIDILKASDDDIQTFLGFEKQYWLSAGKDNLLYNKLIHHKQAVPVDNRLLVDMKNWRQMLLTNIQKQNHKLNFDDEQDFAEIEKEVQKFIDRLVFICCCEDKGIHHEPTLKRVLHEKQTHYVMNPEWLLEEIHKLFAKYRKMPDSDLFDASGADKYAIEDGKLIEVLTDLREPKGRPAYNFDEIDEDILGKVYENFIGHVQTGKKRFKEKEDIGKRKKEGIYYTPKYIVEYVVNNTVSEYIKGKSFKEILKVKILDPACGSGSFLLRAFNVLIEEGAKALKRPLTYSEKKQLLLSCIYGVDLDERAVEITKLTFSLKLAQISEGLPILADNIRHGNSLIDDKAVAGEYLAFEWEDEFKEIMLKGGFDVVIGNPPYVRPHNIGPKDKEYFWRNLTTFKAKSDLYNCFMEKGINLMKQKGRFSFIVPQGWTSLESFYEIRKFILNNCNVIKLVQLPKKVFQDATVETCIFVLSKENDSTKRDKNILRVEKLNERGEISVIKEFVQSDIYKNHLYNFQLYAEQEGSTILNKIKKLGHRLGNLVNFFYGLKTGDDDKFIFNEQRNKDCRKLIRSKDIGKYMLCFDKKYVWYVPDSMIKNKSTARPGDKKRFEADKIIVARMGKQVIATYDDERYYVKDCMILTKKLDSVNLRYLTGILNSKLINYFYRNYFITIDVLKNALLELPVFLNKKVEESIVRLVDKMLSLNKRLNEISDKQTTAKIRLEAEIKATDSEIDEQVYKLYGLTEEEKQIIENSLK